VEWLDAAQYIRVRARRAEGPSDRTEHRGHCERPGRADPGQ
jgi:hypothetical protein